MDSQLSVLAHVHLLFLLEFHDFEVLLEDLLPETALYFGVLLADSRLLGEELGVQIWDVALVELVELFLLLFVFLS